MNWPFVYVHPQQQNRRRGLKSRAGYTNRDQLNYFSFFVNGFNWPQRFELRGNFERTCSIAKYALTFAVSFHERRTDNRSFAEFTLILFILLNGRLQQSKKRGILFENFSNDCAAFEVSFAAESPLPPESCDIRLLLVLSLAVESADAVAAFNVSGLTFILSVLIWAVVEAESGVTNKSFVRLFQHRLHILWLS